MNLITKECLANDLWKCWHIFRAWCISIVIFCVHRSFLLIIIILWNYCVLIVLAVYNFVSDALVVPDLDLYCLLTNFPHKLFALRYITCANLVCKQRLSYWSNHWGLHCCGFYTTLLARHPVVCAWVTGPLIQYIQVVNAF